MYCLFGSRFNGRFMLIKNRDNFVIELFDFLCCFYINYKKILFFCLLFFDIRFISCIICIVLMNLIFIEYLNVNCRLNILYLIKSKVVFIKYMLF